MTKRVRISLTDFVFTPNGNGCYIVSYQSPVSFVIWSAYIYDMALIYDTNFSGDFVKVRTLNRLKSMVKSCCFKRVKYNSRLYGK